MLFKRGVSILPVIGSDLPPRKRTSPSTSSLRPIAPAAGNADRGVILEGLVQRVAREPGHVRHVGSHEGLVAHLGPVGNRDDAAGVAVADVGGEAVAVPFERAVRNVGAVLIDARRSPNPVFP